MSTIPKFKTAFNAKECPRYYEKPVGKSMTVPDMALSIKEILDRFARGLPLDNERIPMYHGEDMPPDIKKMDLSEVEDLKRENAELILQQQKDLQEQGIRYQEDQNYKKFKERYEKEHVEEIVKPKTETDEKK